VTSVLGNPDILDNDGLGERGWERSPMARIFAELPITSSVRDSWASFPSAESVTRMGADESIGWTPGGAAAGR
jgi:hypothetical protein